MAFQSAPIAVLCVDDNRDLADLTAEILEQQNAIFDVDVLTSAAEAEERLAEVEYDCIVSDYDMPNMDGIEFLEVVREHSPELPFILYTGKGSEEVASEAISIGVTDYVEKSPGPEQYELLENRIKNAAEQYRALSRARMLDRIRSVIHDVNQALVQSQTREELESEVCEIICNAEPYRFVWIGEHDPKSKTVVPRASAGVGESYLEEIEITTDATPTSLGPTGRAITTREIATTQSIADDIDYEPWREMALDRGFESSAAIPFVYEDELYGVLNVYSDLPNAFDESERALLEELGDDIAHGLHRIDRERDLRRFKLAAECGGHAVYITDSSGVIEYVNPAFERITGYDESAAVGATPAILKSGEMGEQYYEDLWETITTGERWEEEIVNRRASGDLYTAYQTIAPIADGEEGNPSAYVAIQADISDLKEREHAIEIQRQRYRALLTAVPDPVFVANPETEEIVDANAAAETLVGRSREELIGMAATDLHPADEHHDTLFSEHLRQSQASDQGRIILSTFDDGSDILVETCEGEYVPVEINAGLVEIDGETLFQGVFRDVTDRRARERTIAHQNERLEEFASLVSHDLRNPLTVAMGRIELEREERDSQHLETANTSLKRMDQMIENFLLWSRADHSIEEPEAIDLSAIVERCWTNLTAEEATLINETHGMIIGDEDRVSHLMMNLINNAVEHGGSGVTIRIGHLEDDDGIFVEDNGRGFADIDRDSVFERGVTSTETGTGLGLAIVKRVIDAHDWAVAVTESESGGARFEISGIEIHTE